MDLLTDSHTKLLPTSYPPRSNRGFTLVELIVALGVFVIVLFIGVSSLLNILVVYRTTEASRNVMDNLNFALESMARNLRVGIGYHCKVDDVSSIDDSKLLVTPRDCLGGDGENSVAFIDLQNEARLIAYRFNDGQKTIERSINCHESLGCSAWQPIVAPEVVIQGMKFFVGGTAGGDTIQPNIIILIHGESGVREKEKVKFNVQTFVSQRILDR